jgi:hypothetical protein
MSWKGQRQGFPGPRRQNARFLPMGLRNVRFGPQIRLKPTPAHEIPGTKIRIQKGKTWSKQYARDNSASFAGCFREKEAGRRTQRDTGEYDPRSLSVPRPIRTASRRSP